MPSVIDQFLLSLVLPDEPKYYATNYMDTPYALRSQRIILPTKVLSSSKSRKFQLVTTPTLCSCGMYIHLPTRLIIVRCEDNGSFVIRKNQYELTDVIMRSQINKDAPQSYDDGDLLANASVITLDEDSDDRDGYYIDAESLMRELKCLEEDYNITIPAELKFSKSIKPNSSHEFVDQGGTILHFTKPVPLLPVYIGILDHKIQRIEPLNYNDKYFRTDMIYHKKDLVFYQKFYTSIRIQDVIVTPLGDGEQPLPAIEVLIDHVLSVEKTLRMQNDFELAEKDDIVTKIMHFYQQVYPKIGLKVESPLSSTISTPIQQKLKPIQVSTEKSTSYQSATKLVSDETFPKPNPKLGTFRTEQFVAVHRIEVQNSQPKKSTVASTKNRVEKPLPYNKKLSVAVKLFNKHHADASPELLSDSKSEESETSPVVSKVLSPEDNDLNIQKVAPAPPPPAIETPVHSKSLGIPDTTLGINRKRPLISPATRQALSENATPIGVFHPESSLARTMRSIPKRMQIRNFINHSSDNEEDNNITLQRSSVLEVEQSRIFTSSSESQSQPKSTENEIIDSTNSTEPDKTKLSQEEHDIDEEIETQLELGSDLETKPDPRMLSQASSMRRRYDEDDEYDLDDDDGNENDNENGKDDKNSQSNVLDDEPSEETQNLVAKFMDKERKQKRKRKNGKSKPSINVQPRKLRSRG